MSEELAGAETRYGCPNCLSVFRLGFSRCPIDGGVLQGLLDDPLVGTLIADRYLVEECIGEGGMGRVYAAQHQRMSRRFAIKVLFGDFATDPTMRKRFAREAEAASRLSHPNVISVTDFGESKEGLLYIAMDLVDGPELQTVIEQEGPFRAERIADITRQLCRGLSHAHHEGLIHRDFKGENVILARRGELEIPRIVDFGIAVMLEDSQTSITTGGLIIGTPSTMSPEQATGQPLDARSDLFSLGVVVYEMLAGVKPFSGDPLMIARQNLSLDLPSIIDRVPGLEVSPGLENIARKLMAKRPAHRYQSADEVLEAIDIAMQMPASPSVAKHYDPTPTAEQLALVTRGRRPIMLFALALLFLGGLIVGGSMLLGGDKDDEQLAATMAPDASATKDTTIIAEAVAASDAGSLPAVATDAALLEHTTATQLPPQVASEAHTKSTGGKAKTTRAHDKHGQPTAAIAADANTVTNTPVAAPDSSPPPSSKDITRLYVSVGESIQRLEAAQPREAARYLQQYAAIPFNDALRVSSMRGEVERKLRRLKGEVQTQLAKASSTQ